MELRVRHLVIVLLMLWAFWGMTALRRPSSIVYDVEETQQQQRHQQAATINNNHNKQPQQQQPQPQQQQQQQPQQQGTTVNNNKQQQQSLVQGAQAPQKLASEVGKKVSSQRKFYGGGSEAEHIGGWVSNDTWSWEPFLWRYMQGYLGVSSVLDVGCGVGGALRHFRDELGLGGNNVLCLEGSEEAISKSFVAQQTVQHDFTLGSVQIGRSFDAAWSAEFLEHVAKEHLPNVIATLKAARYVFVTHARPGQGGWHHVTLEADPFWIDLMESHGFKHLPDATRELRKLCPLMNVHWKECSLNSDNGMCFINENDLYKRGNSYFRYTGLVFVNQELLDQKDWPAHLKKPDQVVPPHLRDLHDLYTASPFTLDFLD